ncbi:MAG: HAD-IA family hydrolase [Lachnospiraceae bacterium]|nr:HAD-IA family hydrolase [Lachnospiraceae bacterium]
MDERIRKPYSYILFDLDGTLTDSGPGIMNGFAYAVEKMGGQVTDKEQFRKFVGPPLKYSFGTILGYSPEDTDKAIKLYRDYYNNMGGVLENSVYPGIEQLLADLKNEGKTLIVATSKNAKSTNTVLEHFGLKKYFDLIATADDHIRPLKSDVLRYVLEQCKIVSRSQAVMVGDRENDITAANEVGIDSIGVLYGYGDKEELTSSGATYLAEKPSEIKALIDCRQNIPSV